VLSLEVFHHHQLRLRQSGLGPDLHALQGDIALSQVSGWTNPGKISQDLPFLWRSFLEVPSGNVDSDYLATNDIF
jgi:hypothetical protein